MPITVYYNNDPEHPCTIRPTPLISVSNEILKDGAGKAFGITYQITLNGKLISDEGTPYAFKSNFNNELFKAPPLVVAPDPPAEGEEPGQPTIEEQVIETSRLCGPYCAFDKTVLHERPASQDVGQYGALAALLSKQKALRALFALDGQKVEVTDWIGLDKNSVEQNHNPVMIFYPRVTNISFAEGQYVDTSDYTITLEADTLLSMPETSEDSELTLDIDAILLMASSGDYSLSGVHGIESVVASGYEIAANCENPPEKKIDQLTEADLRQFNQAFVSDFSESWSIEADEQFGENFGDVKVYDGSTDIPFRDVIRPRSYVITHTLSAVGKTHYGPEGRTEAWLEARDFVHKRMVESAKGRALGFSYPNTPVAPYPGKDDSPDSGKLISPSFFGSGALNLASDYQGFNHSRNEEIDATAGSYSLTETWLIASGTDFENYEMSISSDNQNPFVTVGIQGTIKGLSSLVPSSCYYGGRYNDYELIEEPGIKDPRFLITPYINALDKWYKISKSGVFGYTSDIYRRANSTVAVELNSQPLDISLGMNEYTGEITYSLSFDNRPTNIISGALIENISVNETYPGDVFSVIPVIGRQTGPILQYNGSRTGYSRELSIDLTMDSTKIPYDTGRKMLIRRPSAVNPTAEQLEKLINELSPEREPGIRKYFHDPPQESWNPKTGQYTFNIRWTYELDK